jgi:hypothetical protein
VLPRFARLAYHRQEYIQVIEADTALVDTIWLINRAEWPLSAAGTKMAGSKDVTTWPNLDPFSLLRQTLPMRIRMNLFICQL